MRITRLLKNKLAGALIVALCATVAAPAVAGAQNVDPPRYGVRRQTLTQISAGTQPPSDTGTGSGLGGNVGPLPFTGFDVIAMAAVALAVTGLGLALQRAVARDPQ